MEVLIKILHFLWLTSTALSWQLGPPLNIKTPFGEVQIGQPSAQQIDDVENEQKILNPPNNQCFCLPKNVNSRPVINHLDLNKDLERKVVYIYKTDSDVKVYIPNKSKQELFPELHFDENEGDILKSVPFKVIPELFDSNEYQQTPVDFNEDDLKPETVDEDDNKQLENTNDNEEQLSDNNDYISEYIPENSSVQEAELVDTENVPVDNINNISDQIGDDADSYSEANDNENPDDAQLQPQEIISNDGNKEVNIISNPEELNESPSILPSESVSSEKEIQSKPHTWDEIPNSNEPGHAGHIVQWPLPISHWYPEPNQPNSFYYWFNNELKDVELYNLDTPSKIVELMKVIIKALNENGMQINKKGTVTDSEGNLVQMNNIKLRPILVGVQSHPQHLINQQKVFPKKSVPYVLMIEIMQASPPKALGTLVIGTVYLPKKLPKDPVEIWDRQNENIGHLFRCTSCKGKSHQNIFSYPYSARHGHYSPIGVQHRRYGEEHLTKSINRGKSSSIDETSIKKQNIITTKPNKQVINGNRRNGIGSIITGLLGNIGIAPAPYSSPSPQYSDHWISQRPKLPNSYTDDVLPGFRIVGGNPATSSGTPLANKGRSGFPSIVG